MSKPIVYCRADEYLEDALRIMEKNRIRRLPVIDENKRLVGMLALGDHYASGRPRTRGRGDALGGRTSRLKRQWTRRQLSRCASADFTACSSTCGR